MGVDQRTIVGIETQIWNPESSNIYDAIIGNNCNIASFVEIGGSRIGNNCKIQAFVFIPPGIFIEDNVFIGPRVTFCNVKYPQATKRGKFETTRICENATIGAGAIILPGITIGRNAIVGAGAIVTEDVLENTKVVGNPARRIK